MAYQAIGNNEIVSGAPLDSALLAKIKGNFETQQADIAAKQATIDAQAAIISKTVPIGTYVHSDLTLVQFQSETPGVWMLANGQSCAGTAYATKTGRTTVPDARGVFLRAKDNARGLNPDGDLALGTYKDDAIRNISGQVLDFVNDKSLSEPSAATGAFYSTGAVQYNAANTPQGTLIYPDKIFFDASRQVPTAGDNRPKNITVNVFIKVGY